MDYKKLYQIKYIFLVLIAGVIGYLVAIPFGDFFSSSVVMYCGNGTDEWMKWVFPKTSRQRPVPSIHPGPLSAISFQVALAKQGKISLEKNAYLAEQIIPVTVTDITHEMEKAEAYVSIFKKGAAHDEYGTFKYVKAGNSVVELEAPNLNGEFEMRLYSIDHNYTDESFVMSVPFTLSGAVDYNASEWAKTEIKKADEMGLIPDSLRSADLTKPITRAEFAAVSVKLYEKMSGITTTPVKINPFKDTNDQEVLKAYNVGITAGVAADKFAPDELLNREQAATMLTRVFKKAFVKGWTLNADGSFTFNYTAPPKFKDDVKISDWAKPSVYFMVTHGIISGVGDNNFAPRATTSAEQAANYASATREQALAISVRMTEKLDSTNSSEVVPVETQPEESEKPPQNQGNSTEQSQESSNTIVGIWQTGSMTGHEYNAMSGTFRYNSGLGQRYNFKDDGTYTSSIVAGYGSMISITGNYTVTEDQITFSNQKGKVSSDYGDTWKEGNLLKDETYYYAFDNSDSETYLLIGLEDALPPLDIETNAASYFLMDE
ncbi:MAG: S-layer homology domain-containing protein [Tissierellia bacterium]|nr:S-layer homology domain-containing protein [Tissierellia bacterium]